jgi:glycosyltransferase involved in cell wall biosynthesis
MNSLKNLNKGLVSVIIPTYKRNDMLDRAIISVLNQTYKNIEVIVVDDNNNDSVYREKTEEIMQKYSNNSNVIYIKHAENKNGAAARNTGIANSQGDYIAFLDDDDEFCEDKILLQVDRLSKLDDSWGGIYCACQLYTDGIEIRKLMNFTEGNICKELLLMDNSIYAGSTFLVRRKVIEELEGFDESFTRHQDWELLVRFFRKYKIAYVNEILVKIHTDSDINRITNAENMEKLELKYLDTFINDISQFSIEIQNLIFKNHYYPIIMAYISNRKYKWAYYWYNKSNEKSNFSLAEKKLLVRYLIVSSMGNRFKNIIKRLIVKH